VPEQTTTTIRLKIAGFLAHNPNAGGYRGNGKKQQRLQSSNKHKNNRNSFKVKTQVKQSAQQNKNKYKIKK